MFHTIAKYVWKIISMQNIWMNQKDHFNVNIVQEDFQKAHLHCHMKKQHGIEVEEKNNIHCLHNINNK